jgi:hypothetical protein
LYGRQARGSPNWPAHLRHGRLALAVQPVRAEVAQPPPDLVERPSKPPPRQSLQVRLRAPQLPVPLELHPEPALAAVTLQPEQAELLQAAPVQTQAAPE